MVYKRGKIFHYDFMVDRQRYHGSTKQTTLSKAREFEAMLLTRAREAGGMQFRTAPLLRDFSIRFMEYIERLQAGGGCDRDTYRYYRSGWRLLAETGIAGMRMDRVTQSDIEVLRFPGGPSNAMCALRTLRRIFSLALEWKEVRSKPTIRSRKERERSLLIEASCESRLLQFAPQPLADILIIMLDSGMRPEEVMRLKIEEVMLERRRIRVTGKSEEPRFVPVSARMGAILERRMRESSTDWLFPGKGGAGHRTTVEKQWLATLAAEARDAKDRGERPLPAGLVLYCGRHTFATDLLDATGNIVQVQKTLGHQDLRTTKRYLHPADKNLAEIIDERNRGRGLRLVATA